MIWARIFMHAAGLVGVLAWVGYVKAMNADPTDFPPSLAADAMLMAGLFANSLACLLGHAQRRSR